MIGRPGFLSVFAFAVVLVSSVNAHGSDLKLRGFADIIGSLTDSELAIHSLGNSGKQFNFDGASRAGLNLSAELGEHWSFAGQGVGRGNPGFGGQPAYIFSMDWLFLTYRPDDQWTFRAGRQILPMFLYSEQIDVGFTYLLARLPAAVYSIIPLKSFEGALAAYTLSLGDYRLRAALFAGSGTYNQVSTGIGGEAVTDNDDKGGNLTFEADDFKIQFGYKSSTPTGSYYFASPAGTQVSVPTDFGHTEVYSVGANATRYGFILASEFARAKSATPDAYNLTGCYGTLGYQINNGSITPHVTYAKEWLDTSFSPYPNQSRVAADPLGTRQTRLDQLIVGVALRAANSVIVKLEYQNDQYAYSASQYDFKASTYTMALDAIF